MFTFAKCDEGLIVSQDDGRTVGQVFTKAIEEQKQTATPFPKQVLTPLPREEWAIHFTGIKLTLPDLETLLKELAEQE